MATHIWYNFQDEIDQFLSIFQKFPSRFFDEYYFVKSKIKSSPGHNFKVIDLISKNDYARASKLFALLITLCIRINIVRLKLLSHSVDEHNQLVPFF